MHPHQVNVTVDVVSDLVARQFPEWASLDVSEVFGSGTVNAIFRLGDELAARFPLVPGDPAACLVRLRKEQASAAELVGRTACATPRPVAIGRPGRGYPGPWSVQTWLPGTPASDLELSGSVQFALDVAQFISDARAVPTRGRRFEGNGRGGDLRACDAWVEMCLERSEGLLAAPHLREMWTFFRELPAPELPLMTHGDLIPSNLLVEGGRLVGVLDVGGFGPADPAVDLVVAWHLFDDEPRHAIRSRLACAEVEWCRGKAWAFEQSLGAVWYYLSSNPTMSDMGRRTLRRLVADVGDGPPAPVGFCD